MKMDRSSQIIRTSWVGIVTNVLLAAFKAAVGLLANSVAIVMDAVNNLSDALSSIITIVGTKLSLRPADRKHPFGHGRIEYFSAIIIAVIVLSENLAFFHQQIPWCDEVSIGHALISDAIYLGIEETIHRYLDCLK